MPHSRFFLMVTGILVIAALALAALMPRLKRLLHRAESLEAASSS